MSSPLIPAPIQHALALAHPTWHGVLEAGLVALATATPDYLPTLATDNYLPTEQRLFAAFSQPFSRVRHVLVGEGPYPRADSATGYCFMDGAVGPLWSEAGLSKPVNRATSLRNFIKMLLVAAGRLQVEATSGAAMAPVAQAAQSDGTIHSLSQLQDNMLHQGFLLLNASLVFRSHVKPVIDARAWQPFLRVVLAALGARSAPPTLVLWGKLAEQLRQLPESAALPQEVAEHPYNLSFIGHAGMQKFFGPMHLLRMS